MNGVNTIFTIGHSNRGLDEFMALLKQNGIEHVVDVRKIPRSRSNPQYNLEDLFKSLQAEGLSYSHLENLCGFRSKAKVALESAWENKSFQAYAAYMGTSEFKDGIQALVDLAKTEVPAIMCSEAVWWRCHRRMIADALLGLGLDVRHILSPSAPVPHQLTEFAQLIDGQVSYQKSLSVTSCDRKGSEDADF